MNSDQLAIELRARRVKAGLTQVALSRRIGTTQPGIARLEAGRGRPSLALIERWAEATGYPLTLTLGRRSKPLTWLQKGRLVRDVLGDDAFDPWVRLEEKRAKGMNIEPESRYLAATRQQRKKPKAREAREAVG